MLSYYPGSNVFLYYVIELWQVESELLLLVYV